MKRVDLIKRIEGAGGVLVRHGARHREIKDHLARHILKMLIHDDGEAASPLE